MRSTRAARRLAVIAAALALLAAARAGAVERPIPDEIARLRVESAAVGAAPGELRVALAAEIAEGWHLQSHEPSEKGLIATVLTVEPAAGWTVGEIEYPPGRDQTFAFAGKPLSVYDGTVRFVVPIAAAAARADGEVSFRARLRYQPCDETRCLRPRDVMREFRVETTSSSPARAPGGGARDDAVPSDAVPDNAVPVERWIAERGLATTLLLIVGMGIGLNLTPCVYPLISVTLAYFGGQTGGRRVVLAFVYALGIAVTFSLVGVSAALSGGIFGSVLQRPETLVAIAAVMVALALSAFGLYSLQPPAFLLQRFGGSAAGAAGAFTMGLTMGVVAAPCIGPIVVGLLVAVAQRGDPFFGWMLFFALAIGLGAPYVVLAIAAGSITRLPRSGAWLVWVERLFGFVLLGLALYYLSPLLPGRTAAMIAGLGLVGAGFYLGFVDPHGRRWPAFVVVRAAVGVGAVALGVWQLVAPKADPTAPAITWQAFTPEALGAAKSAGRAAVIDFRADWCLPCIEMERTTFAEPDVVARSAGVTMLRADVTEMSAESEKLLGEFRILGVPTTIFYDAAGREVNRQVGYIAAEDFLVFLAELLPPPGRSRVRAEGRLPPSGRSRVSAGGGWTLPAAGPLAALGDGHGSHGARSLGLRRLWHRPAGLLAGPFLPVTGRGVL